MSELGLARLVVLVTYAVLLGPFYFFRVRSWLRERRQSSALAATDVGRRPASPRAA